MPRQKWDSKTKATVVLQGLKGRPVADICTEREAVARGRVIMKPTTPGANQSQ